ncbi:MAG: DUF2577 family protein [Monoglobales bacterium]
MGVVQGEVLSVSPLQIRVANDEKLILGENVLSVPQRLTKYTVTADISMGEGSVTGETQSGEGLHSHGPSGEHTQYQGSGAHSHTNEGAHTHALTSLAATGIKITIDNSLKEGDMVYLLAFNNNKLYHVLDKVV